jgi:hypothetical protein
MKKKVVIRFVCGLPGRYKREEVKIQAWENREKAKAEAEMRRMEVNNFAQTPLLSAHHLCPLCHCQLTADAQTSLCSCSTLAGLTAMCLIINYVLSGMFGIQNKNNLQFSITLNNEAIVLESFIQIFCMAGTHFQSFWQFQKIIN